ncbi:MAG: sugar transferase [Chloroflexi bacterium]|nr:sugar transferase [Chloroflexota bacterium]
MHVRTLSLPYPHERLGLAHRSLAWPVTLIAVTTVDGVAVLGALILAYLVRFRSALPLFREGTDDVSFYASVTVWALPLWLGTFALWRLYDRRVLFTGYGEYARVGSACTASALAVVLISFFYDTPSIARAWLLLVWALSIMLVWMGRFAARRAVRWLRGRGYLLTSTLIVGTDGEGIALAEQISGDPRAGGRVVGFVQGSAVTSSVQPTVAPVLGGIRDLGDIIRECHVEQVVIATGALTREDMLDLYGRFGYREDLELRMSSGLFEVLTTGVRIQHIGTLPLLALERVRITGVDAVLKALLDYIVAAGGLVLSAPILALLVVLIRFDMNEPAIYRRRVVGRSGRTFDAFKFRTMISDRRLSQIPTPFPDRRQTDKSPHDPRITRLGRLLRRASLDELPQLVNVLRGEMSLIGPRMVSPEEIGRYGKWQMNLLTVKPGITGPWQVRGRSDIAYEERVRLSTEYIRNYSIWLDLQILLQTIPAVLGGRGAY